MLEATLKRARNLNRIMPIRTRPLFSSALLSFLSALFEGAAFSLLILLIKKLIGTESLDLNQGTEGITFYRGLYLEVNKLSLPNLAGFVVGSLIIKSTLVYLAEKILIKEQQLQLKNLRKRVFHLIIHFKKVHADGQSVGRLHHSLIHSTSVIAGTLSTTRQLVQHVSYLLAYALLMFGLFPYLAMTSLLLFPLVLIPTRKIELRLRKKIAAEESRNNEISKSLFDTLSLAPLIRLFMTQPMEQMRFEETANRASKLEVEISRMRSKTRAVLDMSTLMFPLSLTILVYWLNHFGLLVLDSKIMVFFLTLHRAAQVFSQSIQSKSRMEGAKETAKELNKILNTPQSQLELNESGKREFPSSFTELKIVNLGFKYPSSTPLYENLNLKIQSGESVVLMGASGVGKSTLGGLLSRIYEPTNGGIFLDEKNISEFSLQGWRKNVLFHTQEMYFNNASVSECLSYGIEPKTESELMEALDAVKLNDWVTKLKDGLKTPVGLNGQLLSVGQRQRLALARTLLRKPVILILDEALTNVPSELADSIFMNVRRKLRGSLIIFISHRDLSILNPEQILKVTINQVEVLSNSAPKIAA